VNRECTVLLKDPGRIIVQRVQKVSPNPMAYRFAGSRTEMHQQPASEDLRRKFETAVCQIHEADLAAKKRAEYRTPIFQRERVSGSQAYMEKRALSDAAQALALLWKL
jgi:hypothetical protein